MEKIISKRTTDGVLLENERSQGVEKLVNELSTYKFFKYLYGKNMFKMFGMNLLMCIFLIPLIILYYNYFIDVIAFQSTLPISSTVGLGFAYWSGLQQYVTQVSNTLSSEFWMWAMLAICATSFAFAGGICVIRNAFWTGELYVSKNFYKGIYQCGLIAFVGFAILSVAICGLQHLNFVLANIPQVWSVLINIVLWVVVVLFAMLVFVLTSVTATYKQSFGVNFKTSLAIIKKYFISTILNFLMSLMPLFILLLLGNSQLFVLIIVIIAMIGMYYVVLVWQTHMMKIFSIYHPIEKKVVKRKKQYK